MRDIDWEGVLEMALTILGALVSILAVLALLMAFNGMFSKAHAAQQGEQNAGGFSYLVSEAESVRAYSGVHEPMVVGALYEVPGEVGEEEQVTKVDRT